MHRETDRQRTTILDPPAAASDDKAQACRPELNRGKLILGGLGFLLLTVGIFWYQFH